VGPEQKKLKAESEVRSGLRGAKRRAESYRAAW
jgi:hypothetical protein